MARVKDSRGVYESTEGPKNAIEASENAQGNRTEPAAKASEIELAESTRTEPAEASEAEPTNAPKDGEGTFANAQVRL